MKVLQVESGVRGLDIKIEDWKQKRSLKETTGRRRLRGIRRRKKKEVKGKGGGELRKRRTIEGVVKRTEV